VDSWVTWIIQIAIGLVIGVLGFFMKRTLTQIERQFEQQKSETDKKISDQQNRTEKLEEKLNTFIGNMPFQYTLRDDFIRAFAGLENKLDKILDQLSRKP